MAKLKLKNRNLLMVLAKMLHETARRQGWLFSLVVWRRQDEMAHVDSITNVSPTVGRARAAEIGQPGFKIEQRAYFVDPDSGQVSEFEPQMAEEPKPAPEIPKPRQVYSPGKGWSESPL